MSDNFDYEAIENDTQIPLAKVNFKSSLAVIRNEIGWLAEELASTMDSPDQLDALIVELQTCYSHLTNKELDFSGADSDDPEVSGNR